MSNLAVGILIGGAVNATLGRAVADARSKIGSLGAAAGKARGWQSLIADTQRMQREFAALQDKGGKAADELRKKIETNQAALRRQGMDVGNLTKHYQQLGTAAKAYEMKAIGIAKMEKGRAQMGDAVRGAVSVSAAAAGPTMVAAQYQAIVRDIAIKAGVARTDTEKSMSDQIAKTAANTGINRNDLAGAVNAMVSAGMDLDKALSFSESVAKFSIGQGATPEETAKMIQALQQNAKITDPKVMAKSLESIAYQGKAGSFESGDMAKWFPALLAEMEKIGITGPEAVTSLGAMLQVQMKTVGSPDEAANNLKNWFSKIGAEDTKKNYAKAGIDYEKSMRATIAGGKNTLEASFELARRYVEKTDPKKAKEMADAVAKISKETDPKKAKEMMAAFEETMKTGDLFGDMQVKAALTAYSQNSALYEKLKKEGAAASGEIDKDLADRRASSSQKWKEVAQNFDEAMRKIGDAISPVTDAVADFASTAGKWVSELATESPKLAAGLAVAVAGLAAIPAALATWNLASGAAGVLGGAIFGRRGKKSAAGGAAEAAAEAMAGGKAGSAGGVQRVFVTNWPGGGGAGLGGGIDFGGQDGGGKPGKPQPGKVGRLGRMGAGLGKAAGLLGKAGGVAAVLGGGYMLYDALSGDKSANDKSADVGGALGNIGGGLAGAAAGAALGSVVPVVGTVIGGLIGSALGSWGGDGLGRFTGQQFGSGSGAGPSGSGRMGYRRPAGGRSAEREKASWGDRVDQANEWYERGSTVAENAGGVLDALGINIGGDKEKEGDSSSGGNSPASMTFSPTISVTVQGDVKNPAELANQLMPHLKTLFAQFQSAAMPGRGAGMYDGTHV